MHALPVSDPHGLTAGFFSDTGFEGAELRKKGFARGKSFISQDMIWHGINTKKHFPTGVVTGESTAAHCHGLTKAILFGSPVWGVAYSLVCAARCSKSWSTWLTGNHMDFRTIYPLTTGINCTRYCSCNYSQTALKSMWLSIYIHISYSYSLILALHTGIVYSSSTSNPSKLIRLNPSHPVNSLAYSYVAWIYWLYIKDHTYMHLQWQLYTYILTLH